MRHLRPLVFVASLAACGARTGLVVDLRDAGSVVDVVTLDVTAPVDAARPVDLAPPPDAPPVACTWTSTPPVALTAGDRDRSPQSVRVLDDRLWVGFQSSNPDPPGNEAWFVQRTDALGHPVAPPTQVLPSPGELTSYGPLSLWTDPTTRAHVAIAWVDGLGCRGVPLDDDARPTAAPVTLGRDNDDDIACGSAGPGGWSFLSRGRTSGSTNNRYHVTGVDPAEPAPLLLTPDRPGIATARFVFDDGSFLFGWVDASPGARQAVILTRYVLDGRRVSPDVRVAAVRADATLGALRFTADYNRVLLAWSETSADGTDLVVTRVLQNGTVVTASVAVARAPTPSGRPLEYGLAVALGTPGVLWNPSPTGADGVLRLATLDPSTLRPSGLADVATARFPQGVFLRGTSQGFVAVFGAITPTTLTQVWTALFRCAVRAP